VPEGTPEEKDAALKGFYLNLFDNKDEKVRNEYRALYPTVIKVPEAALTPVENVKMIQPKNKPEGS
jgi:hypothetical protein